MDNKTTALQNQTKDVMPLKIWENLTPTERSVVAYSKDIKLSECSESEVKSMLKYIFAFIGLKEYPFEEEFLILVNATKRLLFNYTVNEIKYAFDLAIKGVFQYDLNLYGNVFNIVYLSGLMNEYERYRANINSKYQRLIEEAAAEEKKPSVEEIKRLNYEAVKKSCITLFNDVKACKDISLRDVDIRTGARYKFMKSLNLFEIDGNIIEDFKKIAILKVDKERRKENSTKKIIDDLRPHETDQAKIIRYVHNNEILYYFNLILITGRDLSEIINEAEKTK